MADNRGNNTRLRKIGRSLKRRFLQTMNPHTAVGGLFITDSGIKYVDLRGSEPREVGLRLPPGIVASGKVRDRENLIAALKVVHAEVTKGDNDMLQVVLALPSSDVYAQTFTVPSISDQEIDEAASLNMQMISPLDIKTSYYGWQVIGERTGNRKQVEILGSFVPKDVVDPMVAALHEANYGVVAVEFSALGIIRSLSHVGMFSKDVPYVVLDITVEGIDLLIAKNGGLYFDYFYPWGFIKGNDQAISIEKLEASIETEIQKMLHFYIGHWGERIENIIIITPALWKKMYHIIKRKFPDLNVEVAVSKEIGGVYGAALRGLMPRSQDGEISLATVSAKQIFERNQIIRFIVGWRNAFVGVFAFIILLFGFVSIFLHSFEEEMLAATSINTGGVEAQASERLRAQVEEFNNMVLFVGRAKAQDTTISSLFTVLGELAGNKVRYDKVHFPGIGKGMVIEGSVPRETDVIEYKQKIESISSFTDIDLPYSSIAVNNDGRFSFTLRATVSNLNFPKTIVQDEALNAITETLETISETSGDLISFDNVVYVSSRDPITVTGTALSRDIVTLLRDQLIASSSFKDVFLFSGDIQDTIDGRVSFRIQFKLAD